MIPFEKLIEKYRETLGEPNEIVRFNLEKDKELGIFICEDEDDGKIITSIISVGLCNFLQDDNNRSHEVTFHYEVGALKFNKDKLIKAFIDFIDSVLKLKVKLVINKIISNNELWPNKKFVITILDDIFEGVEIREVDILHDIRFVRIYPLSAKEAGYLDEMPMIIRDKLMSKTILMLPPSYKEESNNIVEDALDLLWKEIISWHKINKTHLWKTLSDFPNVIPENEFFEQLGKKLGYEFPSDLRASLNLQNRSLSLTEYEYMSFNSIKYIVDPPNSEGMKLQKYLLPFAEDSEGNMICIDLRKGKDYRIILYELHGGEIKTNFYSFYHWLWRYNYDLWNNKYEINIDGFVEER